MDRFRKTEYKAEHGNKTRKDSSNSTGLLAFMIQASGKKVVRALEMIP